MGMGMVMDEHTLHAGFATLPLGQIRRRVRAGCLLLVR